MFPKISLLFIILSLGFFTSAQITTNPALPVASKKVTVTFDSSQESRLGFFTADLYAHTGLITDKSANNNDWKYVIESWGNNTTQPKLTNKGNGIYELEISPDIIQFYKVAAGEKIVQMAFVFRSADGKKQTNNLYVNIYAEGLAIQITQPSNQSILTLNQPVTFSATSSETAQQKLFSGETLLAENTGTSISATHSFTTNGYHWLIAEATANDKTVRDSLQVFVRNEVTNQPKPAAFRKGINYPSDKSAALVLWAPLKENVFVIGDFNDWQLSNNFQMKKDGDYFWIEIPGLEVGKEYAFQYFIDGKIKIADPYAEKILDPWNDKFISAEIYPGLIAYPEGKTEGIVSVLNPGQEPFAWEIENFMVPEKEKLVIYELLVRDFMAEHTYKAVREKLDYLEDLRINVLELMPVNEFEGNESWGYNPSFYFAPDKYYGPRNELKKLIDECHKRGIAVVIDMVLNHSYGQSPFVQMYMDNWSITADNPWYNQKSNFENPDAQWGYDFNHESAATRELVDSVASFWMSEYKIDGFRFDFTKGFSNTPFPANSWGSNYDAPRIANLKRMSDEIWKRNEDAIIIFEHLSDNSEETELANYGILLWGNMHGNYQEAARGNVSGSDLSWAIYEKRGWNEANLISYPESHDEERIMYTIKQTGLNSDDYNVKNQTTALKRIELNSVFNIPLPGPKMIWQFGERGYDQSINRCADGTINSNCRLAPKPAYWQYLNNPDRIALFEVMAKLNELKQTYEEFMPESFSYQLNDAVKWYRLTNGDNHVFSLGNFDIQQNQASVTFPKTGKWYEFFTRDSIEISSASQNFTLAPGEYRLYSTRKFTDPHVSTNNRKLSELSAEISVYPNPAQNEINIISSENITEVLIFSVTGKQILNQKHGSVNQIKLNIEGFSTGIYILKVVRDKRVSTVKFVKE
ncbi:MAG: T9SS type A sorting domain-containing protein [Bacteroidetes bacterium]|nr:MAG: T9SS type A sorting domain-containing protein [Bacteroidota bacterium]